jgi:hypothetical protein
VKTPSSTKTSQNAASPSRATAGMHSEMSRSTNAPARPLNSGGTACAPQKVARTSSGSIPASRRIARSDFNSSSGERP